MKNSEMRLGLSSFSYTWAIGLPEFPPQNPMTLLDLLAEARRLDIRVLQIAHNLPLHLIDESELAIFEKQASEFGIQIEIAARGIRPEYLLRYLELAVRFKAPFVRTVIDSPRHAPTREEIIHLLKPLKAKFESAGIPLLIENHDRFPAKDIVNFILELGSNWLGVCLDTANSFGALEGPRVVVETLAPYTRNLHLKDLVVYRTAHTMSFIIDGRPIGKGMIDIPWVLNQVAQYHPDVSVILEMWTPPEENIEMTIAKERRWVEESISYLRPSLIKE